jgi:hypothetical protein
MARPNNKQETKPLEIALPKAVHDYLGYLAANSVLGASANAVAAYILTSRLEEMLRDREHERPPPRIPDDDD